MKRVMWLVPMVVLAVAVATFVLPEVGLTQEEGAAPAAQEEAAAVDIKAATVVGSQVEDTGRTWCDGEKEYKERALFLNFDAAGDEPAKVQSQTWGEPTGQACTEATGKTRGGDQVRPETLRAIRSELGEGSAAKTRGCSYSCQTVQWSYYCDPSGVYIYVSECYDECGNYVGYEYEIGDRC